METVHFIVDRKSAFAGALLTYPIYINGNFVGMLKNGGTLSAEVPEADAYYFTDDTAFFGRNAVICNRGLSEYHIVLKRAGGWWTNSYNKFYIWTPQEITPLPSFHFEKFMDAVWGDRIPALSSDEQLLALCMEFYYGITDDLQEVLASEYLAEMMDALQTIGATQLAGLLLQIINESFSEVALPLNDAQIEKMGDRLRKAHMRIWTQPSALEEFRRGTARHMISKLNNKENVF